MVSYRFYSPLKIPQGENLHAGGVKNNSLHPFGSSGLTYGVCNPFFLPAQGVFPITQTAAEEVMKLPGSLGLKIQSANAGEGPGGHKGHIRAGQDLRG